jgi:tetratricopeptide (TPR) repeat protein
MRKIIRVGVLACLCLGQVGFAMSQDVSREKRRALYGSLDRYSVAQLLALYQLYPDSPEGQRALRDALSLLSPGKQHSKGAPNGLSIPYKAIDAIVSLVNKQPFDQLPKLSDAELKLIDDLATYLPNRALPGHRVFTEAEMLALAPEQVDLGRALFLSELGDSPEALKTLRTYEAMLDLMALQLLARANLQSAPEKKIRELNRFVFETMNFRFPPQSQFEKDIHHYTFLPSVLDTRRGVCLGVSILYTSLAQRLGIQLELVTPPGHIFVRYKDATREINVETTLRGVHIDSDEYLGVETRELQKRNIKETVGLAHINEASVYFQQGDFAKALAAYEKARPYLPTDPLLLELTGYTYLLLGDEPAARKLLEDIAPLDSPYTVGRNTLLDDVLAKHADARCLAALFASRDNTAEALTRKRQDIEELLVAYPNFRTGWLHLGTTLLALHRMGDALTCFERYHALDDQNANVEFALASLYAERLHYAKSWEHLQQAKKILTAHNHDPDCVKELQRQLALRCPEYKEHT